jgi:hypothetical protein
MALTPGGRCRQPPQHAACGHITISWQVPKHGRINWRRHHVINVASLPSTRPAQRSNMVSTISALTITTEFKLKEVRQLALTPGGQCRQPRQHAGT